MDTDRFDHLTRSISTLLSRRTLAGALGLGALALPSLVGAKKKKRKKKKKCKGDTRKCGKRCIPADDCCSAADCAPNELCASGICLCSIECCGDADCLANETCVDGSCTCRAEQVCEDTCCPLDEFCVGGFCQGPGTCQPGQNICTGFAGCNGNNACDCLTRFSDDALICGNIDDCVANCTEDDDCPGVGTFCARKVGDTCCLGSTLNTGFCAIPCLA